MNSTGTKPMGLDKSHSWTAVKEGAGTYQEAGCHKRLHILISGQRIGSKRKGQSITMQSAFC